MDNHIGSIISENRQNHKMTQEEFALRLGVTPQAVSKWERGNGLPDITLVPGICKLLHLNANTLLGIEENAIVEIGSTPMEMDLKNNLIAEPLSLEFGSELISCVMEGLKTDLVAETRMKLVRETGMLMPILHLRDNAELKGIEFCIKSYDRILYQKEIDVITDTTFEMMIQETLLQCRQHYADILNKQLVKTMIDTMKELYPGVADGLVPEKISYLELEHHLQKIVREKGNIRYMIHILEELECR